MTINNKCVCTFLAKCCSLYYFYWGLVSLQHQFTPFHMSANKPGLLQTVFLKSPSHIKAHLKYMTMLVLFRQGDLHPVGYHDLFFMTSVKWEFKTRIRKLFHCTRYDNKISQKRCKFLLSSVLPKLHFSGCRYKKQIQISKNVKPTQNRNTPATPRTIWSLNHFANHI